MNNSTIYTYSKVYAVIYVILSITMLGTMGTLLFLTSKDGLTATSYYAMVVLLVIAGGAVYALKNLIIPAAANQTALVLDNEKIIDYLGNQSIHWCDVIAMRTESASNTFDVHLILTLTDESEERVSTIWVQGRAKHILSKAQYYWKNDDTVNLTS